MFAGTALSVRLFVCAGLSLFIIYGPYLFVVVCVFYAYNLTLKAVEGHVHTRFQVQYNDNFTKGTQFFSLCLYVHNITCNIIKL